MSRRAAKAKQRDLRKGARRGGGLSMLLAGQQCGGAILVRPWEEYLEQDILVGVSHTGL